MAFDKIPADIQQTLFDIPADWEKHWKGMPEFIQHKKEPFSKIIVRFETESDLIDFAERIGQKLTRKTKSIWHPFKSHWGNK